jgi:hypothetical protein
MNLSRSFRPSASEKVRKFPTKKSRPRFDTLPARWLNPEKAEPFFGALMRRLALCLILSFCPALAIAASFRIPSERPAAMFSIPDNWDSKPSESGGVEATAPDGFTTLAGKVVESADMQVATSENFKFLTGKGIQLDPASGSVKQTTISDHDAFDVSFTGTDGTNRIRIVVKIVATNSAKRYFALSYWGPGAALDAEVEELKAIVGSIKIPK